MKLTRNNIRRTSQTIAHLNCKWWEREGLLQFKSNRIISYNCNCPGVDWDNCKLYISIH